MPTLNSNSLKIDYVILVNTRKFAIEKLQRKAGYGESAKWTHVAGSLGGLDAIEANIPHLFSSHRRFLCSQLIATGFYKEGDYLFGKPADFDNPELFKEVRDISI